MDASSPLHSDRLVPRRWFRPFAGSPPYPLVGSRACVNGLRGRGTRTWHACKTRERRERGPTQRPCTKPAPAGPAGPSCKGQLACVLDHPVRPYVRYRVPTVAAS
eukprot:6053582-Prymnesium_polylepis.1